MKRKITLIVIALMLFGLLVQSITFAESTEYNDLVANLVASWNPDITRDDLIATNGTPYSESESYVQFWDKEQATTQTYFFSGGRLTYVTVTYGEYAVEQRSWMYSMYRLTCDKIKEIHGDGMGELIIYDGTDYTALDVACGANAWSGDGFGVWLVYNQTNSGLRITTRISSY